MPFNVSHQAIAICEVCLVKDTRDLQPGDPELPPATWREVLIVQPQQQPNAVLAVERKVLICPECLDDVNEALRPHQHRKRRAATQMSGELVTA